MFLHLILPASILVIFFVELWILLRLHNVIKKMTYSSSRVLTIMRNIEYTEEEKETKLKKISRTLFENALYILGFNVAVCAVFVILEEMNEGLFYFLLDFRGVLLSVFVSIIYVSGRHFVQKKLW